MSKIKFVPKNNLHACHFPHNEPWFHFGFDTTSAVLLIIFYCSELHVSQAVCNIVMQSLHPLQQS